MPIYEYQCTHCHLSFEKVVKVGEKGVTCPECGSSDVKKRVSAFSSVSSRASSCSGCSASSCATCGK